MAIEIKNLEYFNGLTESEQYSVNEAISEFNQMNYTIEQLQNDFYGIVCECESGWLVCVDLANCLGCFSEGFISQLQVDSYEWLQRNFYKLVPTSYRLSKTNQVQLFIS